MKKFLALFRKVGGMKQLKQYAKARVLGFTMLQILLNGFSKKSLEIVRLASENRFLRKLRKKYRKFIAQHQPSAEPRQRSNKVWVCWLQGMDTAPEIVQRCYASLQEHLTDRQIILLTEENYRSYVTFPAHIQQKIDSGIITPTHMSDLLRLELLVIHGGTWIDATVFCSGGKIPGYMLDSDLFVYQILKPGLDGHATALSSWFMTACTHHPILELTQALLYRYWEKNKSMADYFLLHDFFQLATERYSQEWEQVIPCSSAVPHTLLLRLFCPYEEQTWAAIRDMTPFHKLTYKFTAEEAALPDTYYQKILH